MSYLTKERLEAEQHRKMLQKSAENNLRYYQ